MHFLAIFFEDFQRNEHILYFNSTCNKFNMSLSYDSVYKGKNNKKRKKSINRLGFETDVTQGTMAEVVDVGPEEAEDVSCGASADCKVTLPCWDTAEVDPTADFEGVDAVFGYGSLVSVWHECRHTEMNVALHVRLFSSLHINHTNT